MRPRVSLNPNWTPRGGHRPSPHAADIATFHASIPGFSPSPLIPAPWLAARLAVARVFVKHEHDRLGLPSFKILGASWAVNCAIADRMAARPPLSFGDTVALARALPAGTTLTTATDGNHGQAVARLGRLLGVGAHIYVPGATVPERISAIRSCGAHVEVVDGSYDDSVRRAAQAAQRDGQRILVQDTSWPGYEVIPAQVVDGYGTIFREARTQLADCDGGGLDVAFIPAGVGSFAASAVQHLAWHGCDVVTVEPLRADCVRRSLEAGTPVAVEGPHDSLMAGLNCGEVSRQAWRILRDGVRAAVAVSDDQATDAVRSLAGAGIVSGESGAAALAGAVVVAGDGAGPELLERDGDTTVLLIDTEGVTDSERYATIVTEPR